MACGVPRVDSGDSVTAKRLRVFLSPVGLYSRAMTRTAQALARYAPPEIEIVGSPSHTYADLVILHTIGKDVLETADNLRSRGQSYAVIQYCLYTVTGSGNPLDGCTDTTSWHKFWGKSRLVWSYYDLSRESIPNFYHAPLGLDPEFTQSSHYPPLPRSIVLTTGYVSGPRAEAIEEVWQAARIVGLRVTHVGPRDVVGIDCSKYDWVTFKGGVNDYELAELYRRSLYVSGLRHVEGFELPAVEGLSCGTPPIMFDQPCTRYWYGSSVKFVADRSGKPLVDDLVDVLTSPYLPVSYLEVARYRNVFNWESICTGFWSRLLETYL